MEQKPTAICIEQEETNTTEKEAVSENSNNKEPEVIDLVEEEDVVECDYHTYDEEVQVK